MKATATDQEKIAKRAYELFEARGKMDGYALEDWILAEKEVIDSQLRVPKPRGKIVREEYHDPAVEESDRESRGIKSVSFA